MVDECGIDMQFINIVVTGDRNWTDYELIRRAIAETQMRTPIAVLGHGDCRGADRIAAGCAPEFGIEARAFPADWSKHGRAAGPIRNRQMLDSVKPRYILAFHDDLEHSKGTKDCIAAARGRGILVKLYSHTRAERW